MLRKTNVEGHRRAMAAPGTFIGGGGGGGGLRGKPILFSGGILGHSLLYIG